ncbi:MAG: hypothetical protein K2H23_04700 [Oscillospiraceae bacterium]|nr:hypothetical protein [Oscillospiraceae bacterium]
MESYQDSIFVGKMFVLPKTSHCDVFVISFIIYCNKAERSCSPRLGMAIAIPHHPLRFSPKRSFAVCGRRPKGFRPLDF